MATDIPDVVVLGAGVAGLTAAHELAEKGFSVEVYEQRSVAGGKARSFRVPLTKAGGASPRLPAEHGFRFFPGFYRHLFDTMKQIPTGHLGRGNVKRQLRFARKIEILEVQETARGPLIYPTQLWRVRGWFLRQFKAG